MDFLALARNPDFIALRDEYAAPEIARCHAKLEAPTLREPADIAAVRERIATLRWLFAFVDQEAEKQATGVGVPPPKTRPLTSEPFPLRLRR
jgi:hypothetical protein